MTSKWFSGLNHQWFLDDLMAWFFDEDTIEPELDYWTSFEEWHGVIEEVCAEDMDEYEIVRAICLKCGESLTHCVCF